MAADVPSTALLEPSAPEASDPAVKPPLDPDIIRWPDEPPPPPEMWQITPVHDWERDERGYIFESRLEEAEVHKTEGNAHFKASEWELALRRYKRAIYHCVFDEMQMYDLLDHHKEQAHGIQVPCKLNLVACIVRMYEDGNPALPDGSLDHALLAIDEVLKARPKEAKAFFRRAQVLMLQQDLAGARTALDEAKRLSASGGTAAGGGGGGANLRDAYAKLKALEQKEKERQRVLFGGKLQTVSVHQMQEESEALALARRAALWKYVRIIGFPVVLPLEALYAVVQYIVRKLLRGPEGMGKKAR